MSEQALRPKRAILLVILATVCWGTSGLFISLVLRGSGISPLGLAFWRDLSTFSCLFSGLAFFRPKLLRVQRRDLPWLAVMGALSIGFFHVMWNMAVLINGVSVATVIQANAPIFVTLMAWLLWREPLTRRKISAVALAFIGTLLISRLDGLSASQITPLGLLTGLAAAITYSAFTLFGKKLTGNYNPWTILTYIFGFGALVLLPLQFGIAVPWPLPLPVLGSFAGLVLLATISGFALYTTGLQRLPASVAAIVATMEVPFAAVISFAALGERLEIGQVFGAVLVVSGILLLSWPSKRWQLSLV